MGTKIEGVEAKNWWRYEWLELFNPTAHSVSLEGWRIELSRNSLDFTISLKGEIAANDYFLVASSEKIAHYDLNYANLGGKFNNNGQKVVLKNNVGEIVDEVDCFSNGKWFAGENDLKQTMERKSAFASGSSPSNWQSSAQTGGSPKAENSPGAILPATTLSPAGATVDATSQTETVVSENVYVGNVFINEIFPSPEESDAEKEWIELFNANNFEVDLSGWQIQDLVGTVKKYFFPAETKIKPNNFLVLKRPETKIVLQNNGDGLKLLNPSGKIVDKIQYEKAPRGMSFNRTKESWLWSAKPTPGKENEIVSAPPQNLSKEASSSSSTISHTLKQNLGQVQAKISESKFYTPSPLFTLGIAIFIAILSAVVVLFLKKSPRD